MSSLKSLLPSRIQAERLSLHLFDYSTEHYTCLLSVMNTPTAHALIGDLGVYTPEAFDKMNIGSRLAPSSLQKKFPDGVNVDMDLYYLLAIPKNSGSTEEELIGGVSLMQRRPDVPPDIGWALLEKYHGKCFAPEAGSALLEVAREVLGITEVMVWPGGGNRPSIRVAEKLGFVEGGKVKDEHGTEDVVYVLPGMKKLDGLTVSIFGG